MWPDPTDCDARSSTEGRAQKTIQMNKTMYSKWTKPNYFIDSIAIFSGMTIALGNDLRMA